MPKSLKEMEAEVEAYCRDKGWYDQSVPFEQAMALLHEEAAEAGHAWRDHGLKGWFVHTLNATCPTCNYDPRGPGDECPVHPDKPEGVGSEFADILIRWLDDDARFKMGAIEYLEDDPAVYALDENFMVNICALHGLIARVIMARDTCYESPVDEFAGVLKFLMELCTHYGIDLNAEYERKMTYNRTRAYRHGGRRA